MTRNGEKDDSGLTIVRLSRRDWWSMFGWGMFIITAVIGGWWHVSTKLTVLEVQVQFHKESIDRLEWRLTPIAAPKPTE